MHACPYNLQHALRSMSQDVQLNPRCAVEDIPFALIAASDENLATFRERDLFATVSHRCSSGESTSAFKCVQPVKAEAVGHVVDCQKTQLSVDRGRPAEGDVRLVYAQRNPGPYITPSVTWRLETTLPSLPLNTVLEWSEHLFS